MAVLNANGGTLVLDNCTLAGNSATNGGGIYNSGTSTFNNCTLSGNAAGSGGGVYQDQSGSGASAFVNTIVTGNTATNGPNPNIYGLFNVLVENSLASGDSLLAPLGNYGGPTQTMPPLPGSPAIDFGSDSITNTLATDQRGYPRLSGAHVDIGAVEVQEVSAGNAPVLTNPTMQGNGTLSFGFTSIPGAEFDVLASTNLALPLNQWTDLGTILAPAAQNSPGQYPIHRSGRDQLSATLLPREIAMRLDGNTGQIQTMKTNFSRQLKVGRVTSAIARLWRDRPCAPPFAVWGGQGIARPTITERGCVRRTSRSPFEGRSGDPSAAAGLRHSRAPLPSASIRG